MPRSLLLVLASAAFVGCAARDECPECTISVERIAVFGESDGDGALEGRPILSPAFGGHRILLQPDGSQQLPLLFTTTGRFVRALGVRGDGPGEFRTPTRALVRADTAWVIDGSLRRATAVASDGSLGSSVPWQRIPFDAVARPDGSWIIAGGAGSTRAMALASPDGVVLREFGDSIPSTGTRRVLARAGSGFWSAASLFRLRFEEWSHPDSLLRTIAPTTTHFPPYDRLQVPEPERPPAPALRGFWLDSLSRIWAVLEVPAPQWRDGFGPVRVGEGGQQYMPMLDANRVYSTVILVIDPATEAVVAERTLDGWYYAVVEPFVIQRAVQDADGWYRAELWRVRERVP